MQVLIIDQMIMIWNLKEVKTKDSIIVNDFDRFDFVKELGENRLNSKMMVEFSKKQDFRSSEKVTKG